MNEDFGSDLISITDDEGNEFVLEHLHTLEHKGCFYMAFLPTDIDEENEDYGTGTRRLSAGKRTLSGQFRAAQPEKPDRSGSQGSASGRQVIRQFGFASFGHDCPPERWPVRAVP